ncbi:NhaP-type Na+/H+ and K+/H+ antiporters with a unique C-terminal domain [uncultured Clostridium sp.]|uniref:cation:proton antiporter n=1 Tax=uncultured Clostridium sp. TaxID=59620 RepID=UPI000822936F|nr:cation:proton antiporter [uncultured Clostridium sp.]SCJ11396.1 NhaP-type Na+/H+ and K+/H+ antiporters with a unique C-terminal domain [uncultured Clostridium sp.]
MIQGIILLLLFVIIAFFVGKLVSKFKLPSILGWLVTGMIIGPHALNWMTEGLRDSTWFHILSNIGEVTAGMLIGTELILREIKKSGKQIVTITIFEGMITFIVVAIAFFFVEDIPMSIALVFGGIALATAPAPSLSIVREYKANGPVAKTLIPLAALDDVLAVIVFFLVIGGVSSMYTGGRIKIFPILMMVILPISVGGITGYVSGKILKKSCDKKETIIKNMLLIVVTAMIGRFISQNILEINLLLVGIAFSAVIANMVSEERLKEVMGAMNPIIGVSLMLMIVSLGAPLDYRLILGAGALTVVYIIARATGKLLGAYIGGKVSKADKNVCKYLGLSLLPHSGVSLLFTGIAVTTLLPIAPEYATMIQGTIAAAAVINEIIAVFLAKHAFKMAGEIGVENKNHKIKIVS